MASTTDIITIRGFITAKFGIKFEENNISDFERNLNIICNQLNISPNLLSKKILSNTLSKNEETILINNITVGETYFYRDSVLFDNLLNNILPLLINKASAINILSVGCSTGEEPYTIAILLNKLLSEKSRLPVNIYGVDVNTDSLTKANTGNYKAWSFRDVPDWLKATNYIFNDDSYIIKDHLKKMVSFSFANIADPNSNPLLRLYNHFDIIFCRNILIYLDKNIVNNALILFSKLLNKTGLFITSPTESAYVDSCYFKKYNFNSSSIFCKETQSKSTLPKKAITVPVSNVNKQTIVTNLKNYTASKIKETEYVYDNKKYDVLFKQNKYEQIIKDKVYLLNDKVNFSNGDKICLLTFIGKSYFKINNYNLALEYFEKIIVLNKLFYKAYFYLGLTYQELGNYNLAKIMFQKAYYLSPKDVGVLSAYGHLLHNLGDNNYVNIFNALSFIPHTELISFADDLYSVDINNIITPKTIY
ncbi:MAG: CheR family methyltransferase [bacterium]